MDVGDIWGGGNVRGEGEGGGEDEECGDDKECCLEEVVVGLRKGNRGGGWNGEEYGDYERYDGEYGEIEGDIAVVELFREDEKEGG